MTDKNYIEKNLSTEGIDASKTFGMEKIAF